MTKLIVDCKPFHELDVQKSTFIVLVYTNRIPPHLIFINDGWYYSLEYNGLKQGSVSSLLKTFEIKIIPVLFIKIIMLFDKKLVKKIFEKYSLQKENATCLEPIKELMTEPTANYIYELVPLLLKRRAISGFYHLNMEKLLANNQFEFRNYTKKEIFEHINKLKKKDA